LAVRLLLCRWGPGPRSLLPPKDVPHRLSRQLKHELGHDKGTNRTSHRDTWLHACRRLRGNKGLGHEVHPCPCSLPEKCSGAELRRMPTKKIFAQWPGFSGTAKSTAAEGYYHLSARGRVTSSLDSDDRGPGPAACTAVGDTTATASCAASTFHRVSFRPSHHTWRDKAEEEICTVSLLHSRTRLRPDVSCCRASVAPVPRGIGFGMTQTGPRASTVSPQLWGQASVVARARQLLAPATPRFPSLQSRLPNDGQCAVFA
jgi:hypothetical protein